MSDNADGSSQWCKPLYNVAEILERARQTAQRWAEQTTDYDENTEQQIEDGRQLVAMIDTMLCARGEVKGGGVAEAWSGEKLSLKERLIEDLGAWGDCEDFPRADWQMEVQNGDSQLGYWDWVVEALKR